jgi:chromosome segregation ATPase
MAGVFGFLSSFGKEKAKDAQEGFLQKLVAWDPETASRAEIEEMIKELDQITIEAGKASAEFKKEKAEAEAANANYKKYLAAAELLNSQVESGDTNKQASLEKLLAELETLRPEVEREEREAKEAEEYYLQVKDLAEATAAKLKTAQSTLERAKKDMRSAEIEKQRAEQRAAKAEQLAGLRKDSSSMGIALAAMNKQAEKARAEAAASGMKATLLGDMKKEDPNIAEALKTVGGEAPKNASVTERLAALRK